MNNLIIATKSNFREYLFKDILSKDDMVIYERKKDFIVNYETKYLDNYISDFIKKNFEYSQSKSEYKYINNINDPSLIGLIEETGKINRLILTGANFLRKKQYLEVSKSIKTRLNIHMGDPNSYRGLDSNLWAMLENKKSYPVVTLHHANLNLDSGEIILQVKSKKNFEESTLQEFISFEIEAAKKCLQKASTICETTPIESSFKNTGIYKSAMNANDKKLAFNNLKSL